MQIFEYKILPSPDAVQTTLVERELNALGAEGWELVGIMRNNAMIFKRPIEPVVEKNLSSHQV